MRGGWAIFWLEVRALVRSKALAMLTLASVAWMFALPRIATGDGTVEGARELWIRYSLGGVFTLLVVTLLATATGAIARERESKRLALTLVRPVRHGVTVLAKSAAIVLTGAFVLALACAVLPFSVRTDLSRPCRHVLSPILPSPREEAKEMYAAYMKDPATPEAVRKAKPAAVLRILENRAVDHFSAVSTNDVSGWKFVLPEASAEGLSVRVRFSSQYDARQDLSGVFRMGPLQGVVSNMTQAVLEVPLRADGGPHVAEPPAGVRELTFENLGRAAVLLRPRRDIELLVPADGFGWNLARTYVELVGLLSLVVAFGLFLSASLGRAVALFVAMVTLIVGEMSPSVISQCPDGLDVSAADRIGRTLTRVAAEVTRPVSALDPVARLSTDACVEFREVVRVFLLDLLLAPILFALLSGLILPRKSV